MGFWAFQEGINFTTQDTGQKDVMTERPSHARWAFSWSPSPLFPQLPLVLFSERHEGGEGEWETLWQNRVEVKVFFLVPFLLSFRGYFLCFLGEFLRRLSLESLPREFCAEEVPQFSARARVTQSPGFGTSESSTAKTQCLGDYPLD